jgi:hypothetical protein
MSQTHLNEMPVIVIILNKVTHEVTYVDRQALLT